MNENYKHSYKAVDNRKEETVSTISANKKAMCVCDTF